MDITAIFKQCLETLRVKNKELALISPQEKKESSSNVKPKIFPAKKSEYFTQARELSKTITSLRDHLLQSRDGYLNIVGSSSSSSQGSSSVFGDGKKKSRMTDVDRDLLDNDVQKIIHSCHKAILDFESMIETTDAIQKNPHLKTHLQSVSESLSVYLKQVTTIFSEMRAVRVKRTVDYQNMSRLSSIPKEGSGRKKSFSFSSDKDKRKSSVIPEEENSSEQRSKSPTTSVPDYFLDDGDLPPEDLQILEEENAALLNQLNSLAQEVDQIQSNVVQIAQLQEIFTEKVLQQDKDIEQISNVVVGATENVKVGNEQIRQAIQNNADFRVWVLFFILVMSFSLLFLDWYND